MRSFRSRVFAVLAAASAPLPAQPFQMSGAMLRVQWFAYMRGPFATGAGELLTRFDADDLTGFGVEDAFPGMHVVRGALVGGRDFITPTTHPVDLTLYTEDPARPGYPDLQHPLGGVAALLLPTSSIPSYGFYVFPAPVFAPPGRDLFVGVRIPPRSGATPLSGAWLGFISSSSSLTSYDLAGPGLPSSPPEANSYILYRDVTTNALTYGSRGQLAIDLLTTLPSGMAGAITNQTNYGVSLSRPGTTTLLSGLHPDAADPPLNPGRADDVSFLFHDVDLPPGSMVAFVGSFAGFGPTVRLSNFVPGSRGGLCLGQADLFVLGLAALDANHRASFVTAIPAPARLIARGGSWAQQAIGIHSGDCTLHGTQCARQHF